MSFRLLRGTTAEDVFKAYRKWEKKDGKAFKLPKRLVCDVEPGPKHRERSTLQCATFEAKTDLSKYGDQYFLEVACEGRWAAGVVREQRFAVAVELRHEAKIPLYERIAERVKLRA
jgi:hypothetical protein